MSGARVVTCGVGHESVARLRGCKVGDVSWRQVTAENWREALTLTVHRDQQRFVAEYQPVAAIALAKAYVRLGGATWTPYAAYEADRMVGFAQLACWPDAPEECWIFHFFIDQHWQGRGYGRAALEHLIELVRRDVAVCKALLLVVHPENERAQRLYVGAGFRITGAERYGEPVYELRLRQDP